MTDSCPATEDFFRMRIDHQIDLRHPLAVLASRMPWQALEAQVAEIIARNAKRKARVGEDMPDLDLFGEQPQKRSRVSAAGRPRIPLRVMISLALPQARLQRIG